MIRKMIIKDWREKKIQSALQDENDNFIIYFEDGSVAQVKSDATEIDAVDDAKLCNLCGLTCKIREEDYGFHAKTGGGYNSTPGNGEGALDDCTSYHFSLCEFCLDWLFCQFKIPVGLSSYVSTSDELEVFRPAFQRVEEDDWRQMKKEFYDEYNRRNAARAK